MGTLIKEADLQGRPPEHVLLLQPLYICNKKKIQNKNIFRPTYPSFFYLRYLNTTIFFFWPYGFSLVILSFHWDYGFLMANMGFKEIMGSKWGTWVFHGSFEFLIGNYEYLLTIIAYIPLRRKTIPVGYFCVTFFPSSHYRISCTRGGKEGNVLTYLDGRVSTVMPVVMATPVVKATSVTTATCDECFRYCSAKEWL